MARTEKTARANPKPPDLTQSNEILGYLLAVEIKRLEIAISIERERNIVFPETTVIIRDIRKLMDALGLSASDRSGSENDTVFSFEIPEIKLTDL